MQCVSVADEAYAKVVTWPAYDCNVQKGILSGNNSDKGTVPDSMLIWCSPSGLGGSYPVKIPDPNQTLIIICARLDKILKLIRLRF